MKKTKKKNVSNIIILIIMFITWLISGGFLGYVLTNNNLINQYELIINSFILFLLITFIIIIFISDNVVRKIFAIFVSLTFIILITFNFLITTNAIKLPTKPMVINFLNKNVNEAIKWADENNIKYELVYEYSDNVEEYGIMAQSISPNTLLKDIDSISFTVSSGPNYDTSVIISNMVGWNIDEALKNLLTKFLNNITVNYEANNEMEKDLIISQSIKGEMKRNDKLIITVSLGDPNNLEPVNMIDLKNKNLFDATLWLQRNGISYKLTYEFNNKIKRNYVISQSEQEGNTIKQKETTITLIISKGKEIVVPDLINMKLDEITEWVITNNLKINYIDQYSPTVDFGKVIYANYKNNDVIEEGTTIEITTSKGPLKMPAFTSLSEFREWASKYNIATDEKYEYNDSIKKGSIIKFSHNANTNIALTDTITVYISNGKAITIPNFSGMSKDAIRNKCSSLGLNCTFYYNGYSSTAKDIAVAQNKKANSQVISGTYVNIGLSSGPASTFTIEISEAQLSIGNADNTINTLKTWFNSKYPNVTFTFIKKASNTYDNAGFIHESSPIKDGSKVTQGSSYQVWITQ